MNLNYEELYTQFMLVPINCVFISDMCSLNRNTHHNQGT